MVKLEDIEALEGDDCGGTTVTDNAIYFSGDINSGNVSELKRNFRELHNKMVAEAITRSLTEPNPIRLYINSPGGFIFPAFSMVNEIVASKVPVYTYVDGLCASAATLISIVGTKRFIMPYSMMMVHEVSGGFAGTKTDIEEYASNLKKFEEIIFSIYKKYTRLPKEMYKVTKDMYFNTKECLTYKLVDEIV